MPETLDFPPIIEPAAPLAQPSGLPAVPLTPAVPDLTKIDLTDVALAMYGKWPDEVAAVKSNLSTLALDLSTASKIKEARMLRARLIGQPLAAARKVSQGIKSKMAATSKAVGAELERIEAAYDEADKLILPKIEEREAELAREREEKAKAEQERKDRHRANIERIRNFAVRADTEPGMTAERIATGIKLLEDTPTPTSATWDEFAVEAANAICETLERMRITHARVLRAEQAEAEAAELRAKLAAQATATPITTQPAQGGGQVDGCRAPESHPDGCSGPVTQDHTSLPASPSTEYIEGRDAQHVLKAEGASPDATDRAVPAMTSPRVGAMGVGQPADAAPAGGVPLVQAAAQAHRFTDIQPVEPDGVKPWPNPTDADLADPEFEAIWSVIKSWDISVPGYQGVGYCGGNGSHVMLILEALRAARAKA